MGNESRETDQHSIGEQPAGLLNGPTSKSRLGLSEVLKTNLSSTSVIIAALTAFVGPFAVGAMNYLIQAGTAASAERQARALNQTTILNQVISIASNQDFTTREGLLRIGAVASFVSSNESVFGIQLKEEARRFDQLAEDLKREAIDRLNTQIRDQKDDLKTLEQDLAKADRASEDAERLKREIEEAASKIQGQETELMSLELTRSANRTLIKKLARERDAALQSISKIEEEKKDLAEEQEKQRKEHESVLAKALAAKDAIITVLRAELVEQDQQVAEHESSDSPDPGVRVSEENSAQNGSELVIDDSRHRAAAGEMTNDTRTPAGETTVPALPRGLEFHEEQSMLPAVEE